MSHVISSGFEKNSYLIDQKILTFKDLISRIDEMFPDGKVKNLTIRLSHITGCPDSEGWFWKTKVIIPEVSIVFMPSMKKIVFRKATYENILFGKYFNPEGIIFSNNTFVATGHDDEVPINIYKRP